MVVAVTYDPNRDELFHSVRNGGAFLNGTKISVSNRTELKSSIIGIDMGYDAGRGKSLLGIMYDMWPDIHCIRLMGSAALGLAYVASGRLDLYLHKLLYPWDIASGLLMIHEAGGLVTDWQSKLATINSDMIVAGNKALCCDFLALNKGLT